MCSWLELNPGPFSQQADVLATEQTGQGNKIIFKTNLEYYDRDFPPFSPNSQLNQEYINVKKRNAHRELVSKARSWIIHSDEQGLA